MQDLGFMVMLTEFLSAHTLPILPRAALDPKGGMMTGALISHNYCPQQGLWEWGWGEVGDLLVTKETNMPHR